jgi:hypothetical protein
MVEPVRDITNPLRSQSSRGYATIARESDDVGVLEAAGLEPVRSVTTVSDTIVYRGAMLWVGCLGGGST